MNSTEAFNFCWCALQEESKKVNFTFFLPKDCSILDSRDTDFNKIENRLAYMYQLGYNVITLVDTCVSSYFKQCSESEKNIFSEKTKICSLSNGPGIDMVGYLNALYKCKIQLKCLPQLSGINFCESWRDMFARVTSVAYQEYCTKTKSSHINITSEKFHLMHSSDIFTNMSPEVKDCIETSDILFMVKVFASTKANVEIVTSTMKEILTLLKPGAIIFFIGSKKNTKDVSTLSSLKQFSSLLFGPVKVTLDNIPYDESVLKVIDVKPKQSDKAYFMVFQRKTVGAESVGTCNEIDGKKKRKRSRRKKKKANILLTPSISSCDISIADNVEEEESDKDSCLTLNSSSKVSDTASEESVSISYENIYLSTTSEEGNSVNGNKQDDNLSLRSTSLIEENASVPDNNTYNDDREEFVKVDNTPMILPVKENILNSKQSHTNEKESCETELVLQNKNLVKLFKEADEPFPTCKENIRYSCNLLQPVEQRSLSHIEDGGNNRKLSQDALACTETFTSLNNVAEGSNKESVSIIASAGKFSSLDICSSVKYTPSHKSPTGNLENTMQETKIKMSNMASSERKINAEDEMKSRLSGKKFNCPGSSAYEYINKETNNFEPQNIPESNNTSSSNVEELSELLKEASYLKNKIKSKNRAKNDKESHDKSFKCNIGVNLSEKSADVSHEESLKNEMVSNQLNDVCNIYDEIKITNGSKIDKQRVVSSNKSFKSSMDNNQCHSEKSVDLQHTEVFKDKLLSTGSNDASYRENEKYTQNRAKREKQGQISKDKSFKSCISENQSHSEKSANLSHTYHSMVQNCETLVTSLEKLVRNISSEMNILKDDLAAKCCCWREEYVKMHNSCSHCHSQLHCRNMCCCLPKICQVCTTCSKSISCKKHNNGSPEYNCEMVNLENLTRPYLVIPVQNKDISHILNLK